MKFGLKHFTKPTPKTMAVIGNIMLTAAFLITTDATLSGFSKWKIAAAIIGLAGKLITQFFGTDESNK